MPLRQPLRGVLLRSAGFDGVLIYIKHRNQNPCMIGTVDSAMGAMPEHQERIMNIFDAVESGNIDAVRNAIADCADVNAIRDNENKTPLHWAAYNGNTEIARLLIQQGAHVDAVDEYGVTPLMQACDGGYVETARLLIERGANVNAVDGNLETVIDNISHFSQPEIYGLLREYGAKKRIEMRKK